MSNSQWLFFKSISNSWYKRVRYYYFNISIVSQIFVEDSSNIASGRAIFREARENHENEMQ